MSETQLSEVEKNSSAWHKIKTYAQKKIDTLRKNNDCAMDELKTAWLRGEISALKALLSAAEPEEIITRTRRDPLGQNRET